MLSDVIIPSGIYEQLRLKLKTDAPLISHKTTGTDATFPASYVKDDSDNILPLKYPSGEGETLRSFTAPVNGVLDYQVEFNLRHAMVLPGHGNYYKLKPNGVELDVDVLSTISGSVATTDTNCGATALANGDVGFISITAP